MFRKAALTIALVLLPAVASAQQHSHGDAAKKPHHDHATSAGEHVHFPQLIMQRRAELNLTDEQVAKLEDISARMAHHHKAMAKADAKTHEAAEKKLHDELLSIFTEAQLEKVRPLMKQHMEAMCGTNENKQCKMETKKAELR